MELNNRLMASMANLNDVELLCERGFYDYIIIGSGMGGGVLARSIIGDENEGDNTPRVLIIERGGLQFSTHCINTPSPGWYRKEGPSMSTDIIFQAVKSPINTVSSNSLSYVGGPVHCIGGRSNVWGLYTPRIDRSSVRDYFGTDICEYLFDPVRVGGDTGYDRAYRLVSNGHSINAPYPMSRNIEGTAASMQEIQLTIQEIINLFDENLGLRFSRYFVCEGFECCPMGAEFIPKDPAQRLYQTAMGGFSTVSWILERLYNNSQALTILPNTQVITVNVGTGDRRNDIHSITVSDPESVHRRPRTIAVKGAKVILSCGTIDTAVIALRSGLNKLPVSDNEQRFDPTLIGTGLTDHDIWGVRFEFLPWGGESVYNLRGQALRLQTWATLKTSIPDSNKTELCLVNITLNATSFLRESSLPMMYIDTDGTFIPQEVFHKKIRDLKNGGSTGVPIKVETASLQVVFEFVSPLQPSNTVLNLPNPIPTIQIPSRTNNTEYLDSMRKFSWEVLKLCGQPADEGWRLVEIGRADFGVVAHEVGTMRMRAPAGSNRGGAGVVDENLKFQGLDNLFVCDLSVFPFSPAANPSLTLTALAQRLARHLEPPRN